MDQNTQSNFKAPSLFDYRPAAYKGETPPRRDVVEGRLPRGKVVLLAGAGDVGKSFLLLHAYEAINGGLEREAFGGRIGKSTNNFVFINNHLKRSPSSISALPSHTHGTANATRAQT
jgi:hypothetical protein